MAMVCTNKSIQLRVLMERLLHTDAKARGAGLVFLFVGEETMAKRKRTSVQGAGKETAFQATENVRDIRWINTTLNRDDITELEGNLDNSLERVFTLFEGLSDSCRLSVKADAYSGRWLAILFDSGGEKGELTFALSMRGATAIDALIALAYVTVHKLGHDWKSSADRDLSRFE